jgi:hypothetical protein
MKIYKYIIIVFFLFLLGIGYSQTENVWRINILNPSIELETPTGESTSFSVSLGIGYGGSYPKISSNTGSGIRYSINPFLDIQHKWFYNLKKRKQQKLSIENNSGNFVSVRLLTRGNSIKSNFKRTTNFDFALVPTWGLQRKYGKSIHLLFDVGPIYYFDSNGKGNIFPVMFQFNIGFDL